jgi:PKD repeat protein
MLNLKTGNRLQRRRAKKHFPRLTATQAQNQETLMLALQSAVPGDVIELASGNYGDLILNGNATPYLKYAGPGHVTITSADGNRGAVFSSAKVEYCSFIRFDGVTFQRDLGERPPGVDWRWNKKIAAEVNYNNHVQIVNSEIMGSVDDDTTNDPWGIWGSNNTNGLHENNLFHDLDRGLGLFQEQDTIIRGNSFYDMQSDGMNFAAVERTLIENNTGINWFPNYDHTHPDFIQFWSSEGKGGSSDVTIRGNIFIPGPGKGQPRHSPPQGIFIRDEANQGNSNFLIEQNFIYTHSLWGIQIEGGTVGGTGFVVRNNTVVNDQLSPSSETPNKASISLRNGIEGEVYDNVVTQIGLQSEGRPGATDLGGNVIVQHNDPTAPNYYRDVFLAPDAMEYPATSPAAALAFLPKPNGPAAGVGVAAKLIEHFGAPVAWIEDASADPVFDGKTVTFHAADYLEDSVPTGQNVIITWDFGDGSPTATGRTVEHTYAEFGRYAVTLTITDSDTQTSFETTRNAWARSAAAVYLTFEESLENLGEAAGTVAWGSPTYVERAEGGYAAQFDGTGSSSIVIDPFWLVGQEQFTLTFDFKLTGTQTGRAIWHGGSGFGFSIGPSSLAAYLKGSWVSASGFGNLNDNDWHTATLVYDATDGIARVYVDGEQRGSKIGYTGGTTTGSESSAGRVFIGGWGSNNLHGQIDNVLVINGVVPPVDMATFLAQYT